MIEELAFLTVALRCATEAELRIVDQRLWQAVKAEEQSHQGAIQFEKRGPVNILMAVETLVNQAIKEAIAKEAEQTYA